MASKPEVFIVESVDLDDEVEDRLEGKMLTEMLRLGGKKPLYFYVRRKRELKEVLSTVHKESAVSVSTFVVSWQQRGPYSPH